MRNLIKQSSKDGDITSAVKVYIKFQIWVFCLIVLGTMITTLLGN